MSGKAPSMLKAVYRLEKIWGSRNKQYNKVDPGPLSKGSYITQQWDEFPHPKVQQLLAVIYRLMLKEEGMPHSDKYAP